MTYWDQSSLYRVREFSNSSKKCAQAENTDSPMLYSKPSFGVSTSLSQMVRLATALVSAPLAELRWRGPHPPLALVSHCGINSYGFCLPIETTIFTTYSSAIHRKPPRSYRCFESTFNSGQSDSFKPTLTTRLFNLLSLLQLCQGNPAPTANLFLDRY